MKIALKTLALPLALLILAAGRDASALNPEAMKRKVAGNEYQKRREYDDARDQYKEALKLEPDFADVHYNLGMLYFYRLKDFPKALFHLNSYRRLETGSTEMPQVISHIHQSLEQIEAAEREDYKSAVLSGTVEAFELFLKNNPVGYYADHAREEIKKLLKYRDEKSKAEAAEDDAYIRALASNKVDALDKFLAEYPSSRRSEEARAKRLALIEQLRQESAAFQKAQAEDTAGAYEEYLSSYPQGASSDKARNRAAHLKAAEDSLVVVRETGSIPAVQKYLEIYSDTPFAKDAREVLENFKKAEVEKAAAEEALKAINAKKEAEKAAPKPAATPKPTAPPKDAKPVAAQAPAPAPAPAPVPAPVPSPAQAAADNGQPKNGSSDVTPVESENKRRAEAREKARKMMEQEIKRIQTQK